MDTKEHTMTLVEKARAFATAAHAAVGQLRKYTFEPYIVHPAEVAALVATVPGHTPEMIAAAWLHDTVEDTGVTSELIRKEFGDEVAELVGWLTDVSRPDHGNRAARKAVDRAHTAGAPAAAQTIKLADLIANTRSIMQHDEKFAVTYLAEKRMLLEVMTKGDPGLMAQARAQIG
jgi:(p)ppGpp synthase/HD superfamily hydrolase